MKRLCYLLDFDGTVRDDLVPVYLTVKDVFRAFGRNPPSFSDYRSMISSDYWAFYLKNGFNENERADVDRLFDSVFFSEYWKNAKLFPDALPTINGLRRRGRLVGIVSNLKAATLEQHLAEYGLKNSIDVVVAREDTQNTKPDPDPVIYGFGRLGVKTSEGSYTGDEVSDICAAHSAGTFAISVARKGSHHTRRMLKSAKPDKIIGSLSELLEFDLE
ncbi:MAG: HAD hydrolase-like protein [Candidatus Aenigmatarchaeota archaeon]